MKNLFQLLILSNVWFDVTFGSVGCNIRTTKWITKKCSLLTFQNNSLLFSRISDCFPWVETFPKCWRSFQGLMMIGNKTKSSRKCKNACLEVYKNCFLLSSLDLANDCFDLMNIQRYCKTLESQGSSSKNNKALISYDEYPFCSVQLSDTSEQSLWVFNWTYSSAQKENLTRGCAMSCESEYRVYKKGLQAIDLPIVSICLIGMAASLFTVLSFLIDWKAQNRYPAVILFILNVCFLFCLSGWMLQYFGLASEISCNANGERRNKEPVSWRSFWCTLCFVSIYFPGIAIGCWFITLNYAWYISFKTIGPIRVVIQNKVKYFHVISWGFPALLTLLALWMQQVDAHPITSICFIMSSSSNKKARDGFVVFPIISSICLGEVLLVQCVRQLWKLRLDCSLFLIPKAVKNITRTMYRLVLYGFGMLFAFILLAYSSFKDEINKNLWNEINSKFIKCKLRSLSFNSTIQCEPPDKSPILYMHLQLLSLCMMCCMTSSWTWTSCTLKVWKKAWKRHFTDDPGRNLMRAQISWYNRIHKKKVSPFIPPVNSDNPLEENNFNLMRHQDKRFSLPDDFLRQNKHHNTDDVRSVLDLFSKRRNTFGSLQSIKTSDLITEVFQPAKKSSSIQSFGHISVAREIGNLTRPSSNLTVVQVHNYYDVNVSPLTRKRLSEPTDKHLNTRQSDDRLLLKRRKTLDGLQKLRDKLYTPLTTVHRDNIVADCVPYDRDDMDQSLISSVYEFRKNIRSGRESIAAIDDVLNITSRL